MDLFNVQTRRKEQIDDQDQLHNALMQGTHSYPSGSNVRVTSPDGTQGTMPAENLVHAINEGFKVETGRQRLIREYVDENKNLSGALKVGLGQFADEAAIGLPELIYDKTGDPLEVAKKQALKKEHDLANSVGGTAGFIASLFFGGPLFKGAAKAGEATAQGISHLGSKIATKAGEEVGKRTANQVARDIAAQAAGMGVEGAIVSAPHAITEAALGDPNAAAETMLAGAGLGAVFGGGLGLSKEMLGLSKKVADEGKRLVGERDLTLKDVARRGAKVVTGVDENDILYYMKNSDKVNQAPSIEAIKDSIDDIVRQKTDDVVVGKELLKDADLDLKMAYNNSLRDLNQARAPQSLADDIVKTLDNERSVLGEMSARADDALLGVDGTLDRRVLVRFINKVRKDAAGLEVGEKAVITGKKLDALKGRIQENLPDKVPYTDVRSVLQEVRDDINWNQLAGEFNERANLARKKFTGNVSNLLKKRVPEYSRIMDDMAARAQALEKMSKSFGTREAAAKTLNSMVKPGGEVKRELLDEFSNLTTSNFSDEFMRLKGQKDLAERAKRENISELLVPELSEKKARIAEELAESERVLRPLRKLTPDTTQSKIRNMGFKTASIETRRALEEVERLSGTPILEQIRDRNVLDAFSKASTQGSRKTNLMGAVGFASAGGLAGMGVGGPIGAAAGAMAGATMDVYGGKLLKSLIDRTPNVAGLLFVEKAMKRTAEKLDDIPKAINRAKAKKPIPKKTIALEAILRILDPQAKPNFERKNVTKSIEKIDEKLRGILVDDAKFQELINKLASPIAEGGAPNISTGVTIGTRRALEYLYTKVPRQPAPSSPFAPEINWEPSDYQMSEFAQAVQVAEYPLSVIDEYEAGGLTNNHMEALRNMFPTVAIAIQNRVFDYAMDPNKESLSYQDRMNLSLLAGMPMDDTLNPQFIMQMQSTPYTDQEAQQQQQGQKQSFVPKQNIDLADNAKTGLQAANER